MMQFISYCYYFSSPFSESTQRLFVSLYSSHPTFLLAKYRLLPHFGHKHPDYSTLPAKPILMHKTAIYLSDTLYIHVIILIFLLVLGTAKVCRGILYSKIHPYLISYTFRLVFMELSFALLLFLSYIELTQSVMRWSLVLLIIDVGLVGASFFWKVRTGTELNHSHYSLFYFNELGPPQNSSKKEESKSILPSMVYYFGRFPLMITILFFRK